LEAAQDHGSHGAGTLGAVYGKNDRGFKELGQFRRAGAPLKVDSIVETPISFDNCEVTRPGAACKGKENLIGGHQEGVQIMTGLAGRQAASIKSGPFLKGAMAIPRLRQDAINPTETIVFPEPPRRAAIMIRGKAMLLVSW
jgi:hypothetical protein